LVERFQLEAVVGTVFDHLVRPAADRLGLVDVGVGAGGEDAEGEVVEDSGVRFFSLKMTVCWSGVSM